MPAVILSGLPHPSGCVDSPSIDREEKPGENRTQFEGIEAASAKLQTGRRGILGLFIQGLAPPFFHSRNLRRNSPKRRLTAESNSIWAYRNSTADFCRGNRLAVQSEFSTAWPSGLCTNGVRNRPSCSRRYIRGAPFNFIREAVQ